MAIQRHNPAYRFAYIIMYKTLDSSGVSYITEKKAGDSLKGKKTIVGVLLTVLGILSGIGCAMKQVTTDSPEETSQTVQDAEETDEAFSYASDHEEKEPGDLETMVVQIISGSGMGSGVVYGETENEWIIVTTGHVLDDPNRIYVRFSREAGAEGHCDYLATDSDLVFVTVKKETVTNVALKPVRIEKEAYDHLQSGDYVRIIASYNGVGEDVAEGYVKDVWIYSQDLQEMVIWLDMECFPGMSGGGVFDSGGNFLGVVCAISDAGETAVIPYLTIYAKDLEREKR